MSTTLPVPDPRPRVRAGDPAVIGVRCTACAYPSLEPLERCPVCAAATRETAFPTSGTVFSGTVLRIPVDDRPPPISLAYVDLDDGPRVLGHGTAPDVLLEPGTRVALVGTTDHGDPRFEPLP